jgi:hypothetical protein
MNQEFPTALTIEFRTTNKYLREISCLCEISNGCRVLGELHALSKVSQIKRSSTALFVGTRVCTEGDGQRLHTAALKATNSISQAKYTFRVKTFRAYFDGDFVSIDRRIASDELKPFQLRNSLQLAIMPAALEELTQHIARRAPLAGKKLLQWTSGSLVPLQDHDADDTPDLTPEGMDERAKLMRGIRLRRGQRESLITRLMISCCS